MSINLDGKTLVRLQARNC